MKTSQDPDAIRKHDVEHRIREARDERAPGLAVRDRAGEGVLGNEPHDEIEGRAEPSTEPRLPCLVPRLDFVNLAFREATKNDR